MFAMKSQKKTNTEQILSFLHDLALNGAESNIESPMDAIVDFINSDITEGIAEKVIERLSINIDFHSYFKDQNSVAELITLKETDVETYYKVIYYESVILNVMVSVVNCPYIIVLNPDDLHKSYYLQLRLK